MAITNHLNGDCPSAFKLKLGHQNDKMSYPTQNGMPAQSFYPQIKLYHAIGSAEN
jgi:hypothetical protein